MSVSPSPQRGTPFGVYAAAAAFAVLLPILLFFPTAEEVFRIWWSSNTYTHGLLVLPISAWLLWRRRAWLQQLPMQPEWLALLPLALAGLSWLAGAMVGVAVAEHLGLVAMLIAGIGLLWGRAAMRVVLFPVGFLIFAAPFGDFSVPLLMRWTADFTVAALRLSGVPVFREGLQFVIPSGNWSVVEACSGIRYMIASLMVGALYAYLNYQSLRRRLAFMLAAILLPLLANWVRAYLIVMLGHLSDNRIATGVDHLLYGWLFFGLVITLLFWAGSRWREDEAPAPSLDPSTLEARAPALRRVLLAAACGVLVLLPWRPLAAWIGAVPGAARYQLDAPQAQSGWRALNTPAAAWSPHYRGERARWLGSFEKDGHRVTLFIAYYARQQHGRELVQWDNRLAFPEDPAWAVVEEARDRLGTELEANRALLRGEHQRLAVWWWYWLGAQGLAADPRTAKLALAQARLQRRRDDSAALMVWAETREAGEDARAVVEDFVGAHQGAIDAALNGAARAQ